MAVPIGPAGPRSSTPLRLASGMELLERWSEHATQVEKNIVYQVLFAVVDRSVFTDYDIVDDITKPPEFFVIARCDLTVKIRVYDFGSCGVIYIGPTCAAPGLDRAASEAMSSAPEAMPSGPDPNANLPGREEGVPRRI